MKTKITARKIKAYCTTDPGEIARIISEADKLHLSDNVLKTAADLAATIMENCPKDDHVYSVAAPVGAYLVKFAYLLNQTGELVTAPPKRGKKL